MGRAIVVLDVREMLRANQEPFQRIMETVRRCKDQDVLQLHATFRPEPLIRLLEKQGFRYTVRPIGPEHFIVQFYRGGIERPVYFLDNRGLEPPQPMMRTLELLGETPFQNGEMQLDIWNHRVPVLLIPELEKRNFSYRVEEDTPTIVRVRIFRR
jgi:uncharacterized protein (DUF2249 family)